MSEICKVPTISLKAVQAAASAPVVHHHGFSPKGAKLAKAKRVSHGGRKKTQPVVVDDVCEVPPLPMAAAAVHPDVAAKLPPLPVEHLAVAPAKGDGSLDDVLTALNKGDADAATAAGLRGDPGGSADGGLDEGLRVARVVESAQTPLPGQTPLSTAVPVVDLPVGQGPVTVPTGAGEAVVPPPAAPVQGTAFVDLADTATSDTGVSETDNLTRNTRPVLEGEGSPGGTVLVTVTFDVNGVPQNVVYKAAVDAEGRWSIPMDSQGAESGTLPAGGLPDGAVDLKVVSFDASGQPAVDENGNPLEAYNGFTVDTVAPVISLTLDPGSNPDQPTILVSVTDSGRALPGETVDVQLTDAAGRTWTYQVTVGADGKGVLDLSTQAPVGGDRPDLAPGDYQLTPETASVQDAAGNEATTQVLTIERAPVVEPEGVSGSQGQTQAEGDPLVYTINLSNPSPRPTVLDFAVGQPGDTADGLDYSGNISFSNGVTRNPDGSITVPPGVTSFTVTVPTLADNVSENSETLTLVVGNQSVTGTITDTTGAPTVAISGPVDVNEAAGTITYTIKLSNPASTDVSVKYATADGTAKAGSDFEAASGTVSFKPGETEKTVTVKITNDAVFEGAEDYSVKLSEPVGATITTGSVTTTIKDDGTGEMPNGGTPSDDRPVIAAINNATVAEGQNLDFTVQLSQTSTTATTVTLTPQSGTADITKDVGPAQVSFDGGKTFTALTGTTVSVPAGAESFVVRYAALKDNISEQSETFTLTAKAPQGDALVGTGTITDATGVPTVAISGPAVVNEAAGTITYTVKLSNPASTDVSVKYATADDTAKAGSDFEAASGTVSFKPGETEKTVTVKITNDAVFEGAEDYSVKLSEPVGATITTGSVTTTIKDDGTGEMPNGGTPSDDRPVIAAINNATVAEGQNLDFTVQLSHSSTTPTVVTLTPASGTADITKDVGPAQVSFDGGKTFTAVTGTTVSVPAGAESFVVRYAALKDNISEQSETFTLTAKAPQGEAVVGTGTITDATGVPTVAISGPAVVNEAAGTITYTVKLSNPASTDVTVKYATADGTAKAGSDFEATSGTVSFKPGETEKTVTVKITNDAVFEGAEDYSVKLSEPVGATITTGSVTTTIRDDGTGDMPNGGTPSDDRPVIAAINNATAAEGGNIDFTVKLSQTSTTATTVTLTPQSGSADITKDVGPAQVSFDGGKTFTAVSGSTVSVPAGSDSFVVRYAALKDNISEQSETFTLTAKAPQGDAVVGTGTITDATGVPTVAISGPAVVNEAAGTITYTVKLSNPASTDVSVKYATADGTAKAGSDFEAASGTVSFKPGETEKTVTVKITNDAVFEGAEDYSVKLSEPVGATITTGSVTTTIKDDGTGEMPNGGTPSDDRPVIAAINNATVAEGANIDFTVKLSQTSTTATTVTLTPQSGSADITKDVGPAQVSFDGGKTFTAVTGTTVSVPAGADSFVVRYAALKDNISEQSETFTITAKAPQGEAVVGTATITDATGVPTVAISGPAVVNEAAGTITYTVKLSNPASTDVSVKYATADGTAKAGSDFEAASGTVSFTPGETEKTVTVKITNDAVFEGAEDYSVKLSEPVGATITTGSVTTTIKDDGTGEMPNGGTPSDDRPVIAAINNATVAEGQNLDFTVQLSHSSTTPTVVTLTPASGTADITKDVGPAQVSFDGGKTFTAVSGSTVSVPAGADSFVVRYASINDGLKEPTESFTLSAKTALGAAVTGTGTITDNDGAAVPLQNLGTVIEEASNGIITGQSTTAGNSGSLQIDFGQLFNADPGVPVVEGRLSADSSINAASAPASAFVAQTAQGTYGTFTLQASGAWKYELNNALPATQALKNGDAPLETFKVMDGYGNERTVTVTVEGRDDAPNTTTDYSYLLPTDGTWVPTIGTTTAGNALANDSDVEGDKLTVVGLRNTQLKEGQVGTALEGAFGKLTIQADGSYTYELQRTPNLDENGRPTSPETFTYIVSDGQKDTEEQIIISFDHMAQARDPAFASLAPQLSISGPASVNEAAGTVSYTVQLTKPATGPVSVSYTTQDGTAKAGSDFTASSGTLTFQPGETSKTVTVKILPDQVFEGAETYSLKLSGATGAALAVATVSTTVHDDGTGWVPEGVTPVNQSPTVLAISDAQAPEGQNLDFTVRLSATSTTPTQVSLGVTAGSASGDDLGAASVSFDGGKTFVPVSNGAVSVPAGVGSFVVRYVSVDDLAKEGSETFRLHAQTSAMDQPLSATGTIQASDGQALAPQLLGEAVEAANVAADSGSTTTTGLSGTTQISINFDTISSAMGVDHLSGTLAPDSSVQGAGVASGFVAATLNGQYGVFTLDAQGHWNYQLDNARMSTQALAQDQMARESFTVTDANGQARQVLVDVRGTNDVPFTTADHIILADADGGVPQPGATVQGSVLANDYDADGGHLSVTGIAQTQSMAGELGAPLHGAYGDLVIGADGQFSYTLKTPPNAGALTDTFSYTVSDGQGGSTTEQLVIHLGDPAQTSPDGFALTVPVEYGDQNLFGTEGIQDVFQWQLADVGATGMPYQDQVQHFDLRPADEKGDVLDLADLLPTGASATTLDAYLNFEQVGGDTVIHVSKDGAFTGSHAGVTGDEANALSNQNIVLKDVNLYQHFGVSSDASTELIQTLLQQGKLHIHD
ncbi:Calx-beta domain-containing protein [Amphibiibacter pelophylacis]|uniref:Calx-beta domain-containing protein n=1 Tax=Amphibiibacter pelophylacis TaxID=1799477 RepID=A0ACC6P3H9_9BURK